MSVTHREQIVSSKASAVGQQFARGSEVAVDLQRATQHVDEPQADHEHSRDVLRHHGPAKLSLAEETNNPKEENNQNKIGLITNSLLSCQIIDIDFIKIKYSPPEQQHADAHDTQAREEADAEAQRCPALHDELGALEEGEGREEMRGGRG